MTSVASALRVLWVWVSSSSPSLRCAGRRTIGGSHPLGWLRTPLLPAGESAQPRFSTQVHGRFAPCVSRPKAGVLWGLRYARQRKELRSVSHSHLPEAMGRLRQAALRRSGTRSALPGSLHASSRHFESPPAIGGQQQRDVSLERLRPPREEPHHDSILAGVPAPVLAACAAKRASPYSLLRMDGQPAKSRFASPLPLFARSPVGTSDRCPSDSQRSSRRMAVSPLFGLTPPNRAPHARADLIRKDGGDS